MPLRNLTVILLNQTNEELLLDPYSHSFIKCTLMPGTKPPNSILAGDYAVLLLTRKLIPVFHLHGSMRYVIAGSAPEQKVTFSWSSSVFRRVTFEGADIPKEFEMTYLGGQRLDTVLVIIISK